MAGYCVTSFPLRLMSKTITYHSAEVLIFISTGFTAVIYRTNLAYNSFMLALNGLKTKLVRANLLISSSAKFESTFKLNSLQ